MAQELQLKIHTGYPMYFTLNGKDGKSDGQFVTGKSEITIAVEKATEEGDILWYGNDKHIVSEVLEVRAPKGKGHPEHVVYQKVKCDYIRPIVFK